MVRGDGLEPARSRGVSERVHLRPSRHAQEVFAQAFIHLAQRETLGCFALLAGVPGELVLASG